MSHYEYVLLALTGLMWAFGLLFLLVLLVGNRHAKEQKREEQAEEQATEMRLRKEKEASAWRMQQYHAEKEAKEMISSQQKKEHVPLVPLLGASEREKIAPFVIEWLIHNKVMDHPTVVGERQMGMQPDGLVVVYDLTTYPTTAAAYGTIERLEGGKFRFTLIARGHMGFNIVDEREWVEEPLGVENPSFVI